MGSAATETLEHLLGRLSNPTEFFEAVHRDFQEHRDDFDGFRSAFEGRGFGAAAEELIRYLDDHGRLELLAELTEERPDELAAAYLRLGEAGDEAPGSPGGDENALWQAAIDQFGGSWAAWDGTEEGWAEYRDWFYDATNSQDPAMYAEAYERLDPLNDLDLAQRIARMRDFGFDVSGTDGDAAEPDGDAEAALWQAAIDQFGGSWAAWDGTEEGWAEYRDWFYDATNSQDPAMYAEAYERLSPLDDLDPGERIARMRDFGFDVSGTEEDAADGFEPAERDAEQEPTESERMETYRALAEDPAVEGISHEVLDELLEDPDFDAKMAAARAAVDAEIEAALADEMSDA
ncbi:hypothetical protein [Actinophytocola sp. KF-1]